MKQEQQYFQTRFKFDPDRQKVWKAICRFIQPFVPNVSHTLELGCGYGDFINLIQSSKKTAVDLGMMKDFLTPEVQFIQADATNLAKIEDGSIDTVFASNFLEHLDDEQLNHLFSEIKRITKTNSRLIFLQPNFRYCASEYFDDYTHKKIFSHVSLKDFVESKGFSCIQEWKRFLPLTMKSRLPKWTWLTSLYLLLPIKPMAKQMLLIFERRS